jgi:23S rRNA pseudouridine1911/1915/1917 synthase
MQLSSSSYTWDEADAGLRVDVVLARVTGQSRTQIQRWLDQECITLDGAPVGPRDKLHVGQILSIQPPDIQTMSLEPENIPLDVVFEDKSLIVLNKHPGQVVHPGPGHFTGTLVHALLHHCKGSLSGIGGVERPGIVHRLDQDTSGLLIVAKTDAAHQNLAAQFQDRTLTKIYMAWVVGRPRTTNGDWTESIGRHKVNRQKMAIHKEGGKEAHTAYRLVEAHPVAALLELKLFTGRTHQIRVHCAYAGCPVVGDSTYGRNVGWLKESGVTRHLLHAHKMIITHPKSGKELKLEAPLPADFLAFQKIVPTLVKNK